MKTALVTAALLLTPLVAQASDSTPSGPTCTMAMDAALPAAFAAWTKPEALPAGANGATQPGVAVGRAYQVQLSPVAAVRYPVVPKKLKEGSFGGLFMLTVEKAGTYTIAFDSAPWIDIVHDGQWVRSVGNSHGLDCTTIRKTVDFALQPGHYTIEVSSASRDLGVLMIAVKN